MGFAKHGAEEDADIEQTSFALLAFLGAGHTEKRGDYKLNVQRATGWLKDRIREDGAIVRAGQKEPDGLVHTLAGLALAEAAGMANMPGTKKAAQKAVEYTAGRLQRFEGEQRGGFGRAPNAEQCDLLTTTLAVMHIKSAKVAGLHVAPGAFDGSIRFLDQMENRELGYSLAPGLPPSARATIMGCFCRQFLGWRKEDLQAHAARAVRVGGRAAMVPSDDLCKWFAALMLFQQGGDLWKSYNESLLQEVAARRVQEGENAGSVDPRGPLAKGGRVLSTALVTLAVEVYYRYVQLHE
ncbi:MAG: hypothetical protein NTW87_19165 [Planctomycetota bacterium]|nr:hypothetical protein [Planctomycetota bacterium]